MKGTIITSIGTLQVGWDETCGILPAIQAHPQLVGIAHKIQGEVFFYQSELDLPYNGQEKTLFEEGDLVYWKAPDASRMAILLMYGITIAGNNATVSTPAPGIKIGRIIEKHRIPYISVGREIKLI